MRRAIRALAVCAAAATALAAGTIDATDAVIDSGAAPTKGVVTIDAAARPGVPPSIPPVGSLGAPLPPPDPLPPFPGGGSGADGTFAADADVSLPGGTYEFTSYDVADGVTVAYSSAVEIRTTGDVTISGTVRAAGAATFRCAGSFLVGSSSATDAVVVTGASGLHVHVGGLFETAGARVFSCDAGDVEILCYGADVFVPDSDSLFLKQGGTVTAAGAARLSAAASIELDGGAAVRGGGGAFLVAAFIDVAGASTVEATLLLGATLSASGGVNVRGGAAVTTQFGPLALLGFRGGVRVDAGAQVSAGGPGDVVLEADAVVGVGGGSRVAATGTGRVRLASYASSVELSGTDDDTIVHAGRGGVFLGGAAGVALSDRAGVFADSGGAIEVRSGGVFSMSAHAALYADGPLDVRAASLVASDGGSTVAPFVSGSDASVSCSGDADVDLAPLTSTAKTVSLVAGGNLRFRGRAVSNKTLTLAAAAGTVDVAGATLRTADTGAAASGTVLVESYSNAAPSIDASGATIRSGTSDVRSGDVTLRARGAFPPALESYLLLDSARVVVPPAKRPRVVLAGVLDVGAATPDFSSPMTLFLGDDSFAVPGFFRDHRGRVSSWGDDRLTVSMRPSADGSSRCVFNATVSFPVPSASPDGNLRVRVVFGTVDAVGTVRLANGRFSRRASPQDVLAPTIALVSAAGLAPRSGKDTLAVSLAFVGFPATPGTISVNCADVLTMSAEPSAFRVWRGAFRVRGATTGLAVAPLHAKVSIAGRALDLSALGEGPAVVAVTVGVGDDLRSVRVRLGRRGAKLVY